MDSKRAIAVGCVVAAAVFGARGGEDGPGRRPTPVHLELPADGVDTPLELARDQPSVEVRVNGKGPFRFLLDTGAAGAGRVSAALAERLGLAVVGSVMVGDPSGQNREERELVLVDELNIAGAVARDVAMLLAPESTQSLDVEGILGFGLFRDVLLTLDYPGRRLRLYPGALPPSDGRAVLDLTVRRGVPSVRVDVDGHGVDADIDSGSMGWLTLPERIASELHLAAEPRIVGRASTGFNTFEIKQAPLAGTVHIGGHALVDPSIEFAGLFPRANLGGQLLRHFALTFDQRNGRVRFERNSDEPIARPARYRVGVALGVGPDGIRVERAAPGSPGERAGLRSGDVVLAIDGTPVGDLGDAGLRDVLNRPGPVEFRVRRGGQTLTITVTPERVAE